MDQFINLDRNDGILKVHSKLEWSDGRRVILVVPRGCKALDSEHELRLLRRWADNADQVVGLVSTDINIQEMARDVGLPLFSSVERAQRARWNWQRHGNGVLARVTPLEYGEPQLKEPLLDRLGLAGVQLLVTLILFGVAAAMVLAAAILLIPSANITVIPASATVSDTSEVILDSSVTTIDQINAIVPGEVYRREISGTATIPTTKTDTAPADHAIGQVVFTNLAGTPATIPLGTIVATTSGITVRFSTTVEVKLPGDFNARVTVPIRALDPGPAGNVKAFQINFIDGPASAVARVVNPAPTSGGTIKPVHIVSFEDKDMWRTRLSEQLRKTAIAQMQADLGSDAYVAPASVAARATAAFGMP